MRPAMAVVLLPLFILPGCAALSEADQWESPYPEPAASSTVVVPLNRSSASPSGAAQDWPSDPDGEDLVQDIQREYLAAVKSVWPVAPTSDGGLVIAGEYVCELLSNGVPIEAIAVLFDESGEPHSQNRQVVDIAREHLCP